MTKPQHTSSPTPTGDSHYNRHPRLRSGTHGGWERSAPTPGLRPAPERRCKDGGRTRHPRPRSGTHGGWEQSSATPGLRPAPERRCKDGGRTRHPRPRSGTHRAKVGVCPKRPAAGRNPPSCAARFAAAPPCPARAPCWLGRRTRSPVRAGRCSGRRARNGPQRSG